MRPIPLAIALAVCAAAAPAIAQSADSAAQPMPSPAMQAALAQPNRAEDRARDQYRHPAQTLDFFRIRPGMTVADYMPASGWYTRVLVPYLGKSGRYIGLTPDPAEAAQDRWTKYFSGLPQAFEDKLPSWNLSGAPVSVYASNQVPDAVKGTVDRVLIFREIHNLYRADVLRAELQTIHGLLKDDGMLGIVEHRAKPWADGEYSDGDKGYMRQSDVIGLIEAAGFELVGTSEVNANPKDTADYPQGVWELPPTLATKRDELKSIGESDRMTLLFRKR